MEHEHEEAMRQEFAHDVESVAVQKKVHELNQRHGAEFGDQHAAEFYRWWVAGGSLKYHHEKNLRAETDRHTGEDPVQPDTQAMPRETLGATHTHTHTHTHSNGNGNGRGPIQRSR